MKMIFSKDAKCGTSRSKPKSLSKNYVRLRMICETVHLHQKLLIINPFYKLEHRNNKIQKILVNNININNNNNNNNNNQHSHKHKHNKNKYNKHNKHSKHNKHNNHHSLRVLKLNIDIVMLCMYYIDNCIIENTKLY